MRPGARRPSRGARGSVWRMEDALPEPQRRLAPAARWLWRLEGALAALVALIAAGVVDAATSGWPGPAAWLAALLLAVAAVLVVPELRWRRWRWEVREHEVDIRRGTLTITRTLVPMLRVQHVDTAARTCSSRCSASPPSSSTPRRARTASPHCRSTRPGWSASGSPSSRGRPMSSESPDVALGPPRRLHPAGIAVLALGALRGAALPLLAVFLAGLAGRGLDRHALVRALALAGIATAAATAAGVVAWYTTTWQIGTATLRHRRGVLSVKETTCRSGACRPWTRSAGPCSACSASSACTSRPRAAAGRRRSCCPRCRPSTSRRCATRSARRPRAPRGSRGAARAGPAAASAAGSSWSPRSRPARLGVLLPVVAALAQLLDDVFQGDEVRDAGRLGAALTPDTAAEWVVLGSGVLLAAWLISMAAVVVTFAGFTVARDARPAALPPRPRRAARGERAGRARPGRPRRGGRAAPAWGLALLRIEVAGYKAEAPAAQTLFPLLRRTEVRGRCSTNCCPSSRTRRTASHACRGGRHGAMRSRGVPRASPPAPPRRCCARGGPVAAAARPPGSGPRPAALAGGRVAAGGRKAGGAWRLLARTTCSRPRAGCRSTRCRRRSSSAARAWRTWRCGSGRARAGACTTSTADRRERLFAALR